MFDFLILFDKSSSNNNPRLFYDRWQIIYATQTVTGLLLMQHALEMNYSSNFDD